MKQTLVAERKTAKRQQAEERPRIGRGIWIAFVIALILADMAVLSWVFNRSGSYAGQLNLWIFIFALLALIPLAWLIGQITEVLCEFLSPVLNGLIEATLSNVPELAIGVFLLIQARSSAASATTVTADLDIIRGLLIGSVINNVLLTLGLAVLIGTVWHGRLRFPTEEAAGYASMLALAVVGLAVPTLAAAFAKDRNNANAINTVSILVGAILIITYFLYIATTVFQVGERGRHPVAAEKETKEERANETETEKLVRAEERDEAHEDQRDLADVRKRQANRRAYRGVLILAVVLLLVTTAITIVMGWVVVGVTNTVIVNTALTPLSTGLIIFPIVCNLGEASGAIVSAARNNIRQSMQVAAGSSVQIPLFVTPLLVFISFAFAGGDNSNVLTLIFKPLELIVVALVTFVYALVNLDGETTWLEGLQLLAFYAMIAITAFALPGV